MESMNVLGLDNDLLDIIGDSVEKDNIERMKKEKKDNDDRRKDE